MAVLSEASLVAGHSGRLLHPDVWKLHAAHVLLRLLARLHLGEFNPGARRSIAAVSLVAFSRPPGNRSGQGSIFSRVQSRRCQMGTSSTETPRVLRSDAIFPLTARLLLLLLRSCRLWPGSSPRFCSSPCCRLSSARQMM